MRPVSSVYGAPVVEGALRRRIVRHLTYQRFEYGSIALRSSVNVCVKVIGNDIVQLAGLAKCVDLMKKPPRLVVVSNKMVATTVFIEIGASRSSGGVPSSIGRLLPR